MERSYYSRAVVDFCREDKHAILGELVDNAPRNVRGTQRNAWREQIGILKQQLGDLKSGHLILEYSIPRMGERADAILIYSDFVFVMEFKTGRKSHAKTDTDQCLDYAVDLKNFHRESHPASIVPVLISTGAARHENSIGKGRDGVYDIMLSNGDDLGAIIRQVCSNRPDSTIRAAEWERSPYEPTPTIIQAALALCRERGMDYMVRTDANAQNLGKTMRAMDRIITESRRSGRKSICFVTGVPGSGKTLAGLTIVCRNQSDSGGAVFFTGNDPLTKVLRSALRGKNAEEKYGTGTRVLIQHIKDFVADAGGRGRLAEKIIVFDEAQRAWTAEKMSSRTGGNAGSPVDGMSQPSILLDAMGRHTDWAVVICLIGIGQEIHTGEAGLSEWFKALEGLDWDVYVPDVKDGRYAGGTVQAGLPPNSRLKKLNALHLGTSVRSFKSENVSMFVDEVLGCDTDSAIRTFSNIGNRYPIFLTRDLNRAKGWLRYVSRGNERYGLVASSNAKRLRPLGICLGSRINPVRWFLSEKADPFSSFSLEVAATEFDTQGLELDWTCLAWDGDLRFENGGWSPYRFRGRRWEAVQQEAAADYLKNAYRVLMTRARQGMVIFVPSGDEHDNTRRSEFYDGTYEYLRSIGLGDVPMGAGH